MGWVLREGFLWEASDSPRGCSFASSPELKPAAPHRRIAQGKTGLANNGSIPKNKKMMG
jgi:hypothetical protein